MRSAFNLNVEEKIKNEDVFVSIRPSRVKLDFLVQKSSWVKFNFVGNK